MAVATGTAILGGAALSAAAGMGSAAISRGGGGGGGGVADWVAPRDPWTEGRLKQTSDYISGGLSQLQAGEEVPWLKNYAPMIEEYLKKSNKKFFLGSEGDRGGSQMGLASQFGAATGVGPKATMSYGRKFLQDYSDKESAIDAQIAQMRFGAQQQAASQFPQWSMQMPQGPNSQPIQYQEPTSPDYLGQSMSGIGQALPYLMKDMFKAPTSTSGPSVMKNVLAGGGLGSEGSVGSGWGLKPSKFY